MRLPNMSRTLKRYEQSVLLKTRTITSVDFEEVETVSVSSIKAVVQVADKKKLNPNSIDWSKQYIWIHSSVNMEIGQYIEWHGKDFKLVSAGDDYSDYGYTAWYGEETLQPILVAT